MKIAVASGKGGTGKTTVAVSLARSLASRIRPGKPGPLLLDCDVEAPDAHLFLNPELGESASATVQVPAIDPDRCLACGDCAQACQFNALAVLGEEVLLLPDLCHGCGTCGLVCPTGAITEYPREIGILEKGPAGKVQYARGLLNVGEALAVPVIRQLQEWARPREGQITILDAPPGTSCPMVETISEVDFVLLVTEPTPFGIHDLALAVEVLRELGIPGGAVINRDGVGDAGVEDFCISQGIPILLRIPFRREVAQGIAQGRTLLEILPEYEARLRDMILQIETTLENHPGRERRPGGAGTASPSMAERGAV